MTVARRLRARLRSLQGIPHPPAGWMTHAQLARILGARNPHSTGVRRSIQRLLDAGAIQRRYYSGNRPCYREIEAKP
jgi:hypothetical protein